MISHFPVGRFGTMKERFFLIHNQIGTPSAICFAWDKLCLLDDLDYIIIMIVITFIVIRVSATLCVYIYIHIRAYPII